MFTIDFTFEVRSTVVLMKVVVLGSNGMLGSRLKKVLEISGWDVVAPVNIRLQSPDLGDFLYLHKDYHYLVNCIAKTDVNACENGYNEANYCLEQLVRKPHGMKIIHISTDYVFDGKKGNYSESSPVNPVNEYGKSKLLGEDFLLNKAKHATIVRTSWLFSESPRCYPAQYLKLIKSPEFSRKQRTVLASKRVGTPTSTHFLACSLLDGMKKGVPNLEIFHLAGTTPTTYHQFLTKIGKRYAEINDSKTDYVSCLKEVDDSERCDLPLRPQRPFNTSLNSDKWRSHGFENFGNLGEMIDMFVRG